MCAMRATCSGILNMCILSSVQSVQSVQSVPNNKDIVIKVKERYDNINKPETIKELNAMRTNIIERIYGEMLVDLPGENDFDKEQIGRIVDDYFKTRGWM